MCASFHVIDPKKNCLHYSQMLYKPYFNIKTTTKWQKPVPNTRTPCTLSILVFCVVFYFIVNLVMTASISALFYYENKQIKYLNF